MLYMYTYKPIRLASQYSFPVGSRHLCTDNRTGSHRTVCVHLLAVSAQFNLALIFSRPHKLIIQLVCYWWIYLVFRVAISFSQICRPISRHELVFAHLDIFCLVSPIGDILLEQWRLQRTFAHFTTGRAERLLEKRQSSEQHFSTNLLMENCKPKYKNN